MSGWSLACFVFLAVWLLRTNWDAAMLILDLKDQIRDLKAAVRDLEQRVNHLSRRGRQNETA